jgi:chemotaxis protein methyltransferase CheR
MGLTDGEIKLSNECYKFIANLVYEHSRIRLGADKQPLVSGRLNKRLKELGINSYEAYCDLLRGPVGQAELSPLVDLISTNHTHFFREVQHMDFLRDHILPQWLPMLRPTEPFRVWSAASSSGEEPYTIAIVLAEYFRTHQRHPWQIEGSDISTRILDHAKNGIYGKDRVKLPDPQYLPRYFQKGTGDFEEYYRVKKELRDLVRFHHWNLLHSPYPVAKDQHVIFCRNVMIYFDQKTQQELVDLLTAQLAPGGFLIVGHSESLLSVKHKLQSVKTTIYRRAV